MTLHSFNPIQRPGLAYQHAFDWLATHLHAAGGSVACLAPSVFHGTELLRRLPSTPFLVPVPAGLETAALALGIESIQTIPSNQASLAAVAWIEPPGDDIKQLDRLHHILQPDGRLYLITGGKLARFLAERRRQKEENPFLNEAKAIQNLPRYGFRLVRRVGIQGLTAVAWHYAGVMTGRLGNNAWQDRCHFGMRRAFVEQDDPRFVALTCLVAERAA